MGAQADDVVGELEHGAAQGEKILFGARPQDADLAGVVDQPVDGGGVHTQGDVGGLCAFPRRDGGEGFGAGRGRGGSLRRCQRRQGGKAAEERIGGFDAVARELAGRGPGFLEFLLQTVDALAELQRAGHAGAALEGVQGTGDRLDVFLVARFAPTVELLEEALEERLALVEEDRQELQVDFLGDFFHRRRFSGSFWDLCGGGGFRLDLVGSGGLGWRHRCLRNGADGFDEGQQIGGRFGNLSGFDALEGGAEPLGSSA